MLYVLVEFAACCTNPKRFRNCGFKMQNSTMSKQIFATSYIIYVAITVGIIAQCNASETTESLTAVILDFSICGNRQ